MENTYFEQLDFTFSCIFSKSTFWQRLFSRSQKPTEPRLTDTYFLSHSFRVAFLQKAAILAKGRWADMLSVHCKVKGSKEKL